MISQTSDLAKACSKKVLFSRRYSGSATQREAICCPHEADDDHVAR